MDTKTLIYNYLDKNGIRVRSFAKISISYDRGVKQDFKNVIVPLEPHFGLSESDFSQVIVDYIYETTNINIESIENLDKYPTLNGLPFLLKLYDDTSNNYFYSLAFGHISGSITIRSDYDISSLGNIEKIDGDLGFIESNISSLGKLQKVTGSLWIAQRSPFTNLLDLGLLESVGGDLNIKSSQIKDLRLLETVGGTLNLRKTNIDSLGKLRYVGNHLYLPTAYKGKFDLSNIDIKGKVKYFKE